MPHFRQAIVLLCAISFVAVIAKPDSAGRKPLPGPGLSYGGIPYGSMSGNVADFFRRQATSGGRSANLAATSDIDFTPIEQWL